MHSTTRWNGPRLATLLAAFLVSRGAVPAHAEITADARPVIQRYIEATGGQAAFDALRTVRFKTTLRAAGTDRSITSYTARPDRTAAEMVVGKLRVAWGFDGQHGWTMDQFGKVLPQEGEKLETAKESAYFANLLWLTADQGGGHVSISESQSDSSGACSILEVAAPGRRPRSYWFNKKTGLLDRAVTSTDEATRVTEFSDYRSVGGRLFSFSEHTRTVGKPELDVVAAVTSVAVNEQIDDSRFKMPTESAAAAKDWRDHLLAGLYRGIKLWKPAKTSLSSNTIKEPGTIFVIQKDGLSGTLAGQGFAANIVTDGTISQKGSLANMVLGGGANRRDFKAGDKFYFTGFNVKDKQISFDLVSYSTFDVTTEGTTKAERYLAQLQFAFPEGYLATAEPDKVQQVLDAVILPEEFIKSAQPATVELGQTFQQVEKALGRPSRVVNLGAKSIWIYNDMKVVFMDGKVSDVQ